MRPITQKTVTIENDSLEAALEKAVEVANESDAWSSSDYCGPTFIEAVAEGGTMWICGTDEKGPPLPVPDRFTEEGVRR